MKTNIFTFRPVCFLILFFSFISHSVGQSLYRVSIEQKITESTVVIEGKVVRQKSFWNPAHSMIYTTSTVEVYKEFKGTSKTEIEVLTVGGQVGNDIILASDLLTLSPGQTGIFFLHPNTMHLKSPVSKSLLLDVYSSQQGFIGYDLANQKASAPFIQYRSITGELYTEIRRLTGRSYINKKPSFKVGSFAPAIAAQIAAITSFTPATVTAGTILDPANNILTIDGSAFGTGAGTAAILFDDANNGPGGTPFTVLWNDPFVISWTDTRIRVRVPTSAGTGTFQVRDDVGTVTSSPAPLNVLYSVFAAAISDGTTFHPKEFRLADLNGIGGFTIEYNNNIAGTLSQATFQRALTTWKETCGFNITEGANTAIQAVTPDDMNIVMLDNAGTGNAPLAAGVLGVCYSYFALCGGASIATDQILKSEFDIVLRNPGFSTGATNFAIGPCSPNSINNGYADLETVILHELGHAINLGHIIETFQPGAIGQVNPVKLMHFATLAGTKRSSPDYSAKSGADYATTPRGISFGGCVTEMVKLSTTIESKDDCPVSFPLTSIAPNTLVNFDLNHSTSNRFVDPNYTQVRCDGLGTDITTNAYYAFRTTNTGGIISLNVTGYNTTPAAQESCTSVYGGVLVTGVRLALYQVSSCPTAQSFPAPVVCRTITGNGLLADITGLAANTTYLLYLGGIDNTKANFALTFAGSALLPVKFSDFNGLGKEDHNLLTWNIDYAYDVRSIHMERSHNGINFEDIGVVTHSLADKKGAFKDIRPLANSNYYRLVTINNDGSKEYSKVILLTRNEQLRVNVFPNPVKDLLNIEINAEKTGKFIIMLYNSAGQMLMQRQIRATAISQIIKIPVSKLTTGQYHLVVYNDQNKIVKNTTVTIQ